MEHKPGDDFDDVGRKGGSARKAGDNARRWTPHGGKSHDRRIKLTPFNEIKLTPEPAWLVRELIPRRGVVVIWGPEKCGKSFWTYDLDMRIALGLPYRGRRVVQGPVVYCAFEGQGGMAKRTEAFRQRYMVEHDGEVPFYLVTLRLDLIKDHQELIEDIRAQIGDVVPVTITLDTLNRSLKGSESNDEDMTDYFNAASALSDAFGSVTKIIHHCGVDKTRSRGHTSLTCNADAEIAITRDASKVITAHVVHMKDGPDGPDGACIGSSLDVVEVGLDSDDEIITSCVIIPVDSVERPKATRGRKPRKPPSSVQIALVAFNQAIAEAGKVPPASNHIPHNTKTASKALWRKYAYARGISPGDSDDERAKAKANAKAFERAFTRLIADGTVATWNDECWLTGKD
jgi:hypothetical protein